MKMGSQLTVRIIRIFVHVITSVSPGAVEAFGLLGRERTSCGLVSQASRERAGIATHCFCDLLVIHLRACPHHRDSPGGLCRSAWAGVFHDRCDGVIRDHIFNLSQPFQ